MRETNIYFATVLLNKYNSINNFLSVISGLLGLIGSIVSLTLVSDISNIARVAIGNVVGHNLGTAIGKSHAVLAIGSITITVLVLGKASSRVIISNSIAILVDSRAIISRLMVSSSGVSGLVGRSGVSHRLVSRSRGRVVDRGRLVDRSRVVDGSRLVVSGSRVVDGSGLVVSRGRVVDRSGLVVSRSGMVDRGMDRDVAGSMSSGNILLLIVVLVDLIRGGSGLGGHLGVVRAMGFVDGGSDGGGIAVFDALVAVLVGNSQSQESGESNESLKN